MMMMMFQASQYLHEDFDDDVDDNDDDDDDDDDDVDDNNVVGQLIELICTRMLMMLFQVSLLICTRMVESGVVTPEPVDKSTWRQVTFIGVFTKIK